MKKANRNISSGSSSGNTHKSSMSGCPQALCKCLLSRSCFRFLFVVILTTVTFMIYIILFNSKASKQTAILHDKDRDILDNPHKESIEADLSARDSSEQIKVIDVTVILNVFKRILTLKKQLRYIILEQSVKPKYVWVCIFNSPYSNEIEDVINKFNKQQQITIIKIIKSNYNFKYFGRFQVALEAKTEFIAFYDDDQIPQPNNLNFFFKAATETEIGRNAILGMTARVFNKVSLPIFRHSSQKQLPNPRRLNGHGYSFGGIPRYYNNAYRWYDSTDGYWAPSRNHWCEKEKSMNERLVQVDALNRHWFIRKDHLSALFSDDAFSYFTMEDYTISMLASKYYGVRTYTICPDHKSQLVLLDEVNTCSSTDFLEMNEFRGFMINRMYSSGYQLTMQTNYPLGDRVLIVPFQSSLIPSSSTLDLPDNNNDNDDEKSAYSNVYINIVDDTKEFDECYQLDLFCARHHHSIAGHKTFIADVVELLKQIGAKRLSLYHKDRNIEEEVKIAWKLYQLDLNKS